MFWEWIGFGIVAVGGFVVLQAIVQALDLKPSVRRLLIIGYLLRIAGSLARYEVIFRFYGGLGDAVVYFNVGQMYAERIHAFDFSFLWDPAGWWAGHWWGTQFVRTFTGFVVALVGPTMRGGFLFFSLVSYTGLCLFGLAFHRAYPHLNTARYLAWILLWPSLWFWPSSIGKDSLMLLAVGLVTAGYVGRRETLGWPFLVAGLLLATSIRPHVAGVTVVGLAIAHWLGTARRMTPWNIAQALGLGLVALFVLSTALGQLGLEDTDIEGVQEFVARQASLTAQGGSNIGVQAGGWLQVPMAYVNILMRPFPWEIHNPPSAVAALELMLFWSVFYRRRRRILGGLRHWRTDRMLRLAVPLTLMYVAMIGLVFGNLGIIARQRAVVLPLLLLFLEAVPAAYAVKLVRASKARWVPPTHLDPRVQPTALTARRAG